MPSPFPPLYYLLGANLVQICSRNVDSPGRQIDHINVILLFGQLFFQTKQALTCLILSCIVLKDKTGDKLMRTLLFYMLTMHLIFEPSHEKTFIFDIKDLTDQSCCLSPVLSLHMKSHYFLNPKFQASSHLLGLHSPVCI